MEVKLWCKISAAHGCSARCSAGNNLVLQKEQTWWLTELISLEAVLKFVLREIPAWCNTAYKNREGNLPAIIFRLLALGSTLEL